MSFIENHLDDHAISSKISDKIMNHIYKHTLNISEPYTDDNELAKTDQELFEKVKHLKNDLIQPLAENSCSITNGEYLGMEMAKAMRQEYLQEIIQTKSDLCDQFQEILSHFHIFIDDAIVFPPGNSARLQIAFTTRQQTFSASPRHGLPVRAN